VCGRRPPVPRRRCSAPSASGAQVSDQDQDTLNPIGVNCIRQFAASGIVCWGSRTLGTLSNPEYRYVPVRRMAKLPQGVSLPRHAVGGVRAQRRAAVAAIRFNLNAFMGSLFRAGAFQGTKPEEAFFVKCDKDNNTQATIRPGTGSHPGGLCAA